MMQISWTMFSILSGGIYFHEYRVFTLLTGSMFALGVAVRLAWPGIGAHTVRESMPV